MRKSFSLISVLVIVTVLTGCAAMPGSKDMTVLDTQPAPLTPDPGGAVVTFYRPWSFLGGALSFYVSEHGQNIGALKNGTYFSIRTSPGTHVYSAATESTEQITVQIQPGGMIYIKGSMSFGFFAGRPNLQQALIGDARKAIEKLDYVEFHGR